MSESTKNKSCVVIGASHAGVNFAFSLRKEGWEGTITLFDKDPEIPYHRPPLSKAYLTTDGSIEDNWLKSLESYTKNDIILRLGIAVSSINRESKHIVIEDGTVQGYDKLVIATGARPIIPSIPGIESAQNLFSLRTAANVESIREALNKSKQKRVVIIGGGYIGLEIAASLKKLNAQVTVLEREERILARVTAPEMSQFFENLHAENNVIICTKKNVTSITNKEQLNTVICADNSSYKADIIIVGVGIHVNQEIAKEAGLTIKNGIVVNASCQTNDPAIYAIGDCTFHHNPHYDRNLRLESVQNAVEQAKIAAAAICDKNPTYAVIPWFWSDQYDIKLQMVGLATGYNETLYRDEQTEEGYKFSIWYFKDETLLAVDAVNNAKAYVIGTKFIKEGKKIDKSKLISTIDFKPANLLLE